MKLVDTSKEFYDSLFPSVKYIDKINSVLYHNVILYGAQGQSKSKTAEKIVEEAVNRYGIENVNAVKTRKDLKKLLDEGIDNSFVQILFADDLTLSKINIKELEDFYNVRHILESKGTEKGLVITIEAVHDFFAIHKNLRTFFTHLIICNPPTNTFDKNFISQYIGIDFVNLLEQIFRKRREDIDYYSYKAYWFIGNRGILYTPLAEIDYFSNLSTQTSNSISLDNPVLDKTPNTIPKNSSILDTIAKIIFWIIVVTIIAEILF